MDEVSISHFTLFHNSSLMVGEYRTISHVFSSLIQSISGFNIMTIIN